VRPDPEIQVQNTKGGVPGRPPPFVHPGLLIDKGGMHPASRRNGDLDTPGGRSIL